VLIQRPGPINTGLVTRFLHSWMICTLQVRLSSFVCMAHVTDLQGAYNLVRDFPPLFISFYNSISFEICCNILWRN
jgi:hypothetical protein